jgi:hypothetical protein
VPVCASLACVAVRGRWQERSLLQRYPIYSEGDLVAVGSAGGLIDAFAIAGAHYCRKRPCAGRCHALVCLAIQRDMSDPRTG